MRGLLVRCGIDQAYGGWNAPVHAPSGRFVYVPLPESRTSRPDLARRFRELRPNLDSFCRDHGLDAAEDLGFPRDLWPRSMHLDPDFEHLTYGDDGDHRGAGVATLQRGDLIAFYSGMRPVCGEASRLDYALIGLFVVDRVSRIDELRESEWHTNAHTRRRRLRTSDVIVQADRSRSGRFSRALSIGEWRNRAYRVRRDLLEEWGGLSVKDGFIQRSGVPPELLEPERFLAWVERQGAELLRENNPTVASKTTKSRGVIIVNLRRPRNDPRESRADPFWEFGSFGLTGCHSTNLMHPRRAPELEGCRFAFAQGGPEGFRLVLLTPPITVHQHADRVEVRWRPFAKAFRYGHAPTLVNNQGESDFPRLLKLLETVDRSTWQGAFSSRFRSKRSPLDTDVGSEVEQVYDDAVATAPPSAFAECYADTMAERPPSVDSDRRGTFEMLLARASTRGPVGRKRTSRRTGGRARRC